MKYNCLKNYSFGTPLTIIGTIGKKKHKSNVKEWEGGHAITYKKIIWSILCQQTWILSEIYDFLEKTFESDAIKIEIMNIQKL